MLGAGQSRVTVSPRGTVSAAGLAIESTPTTRESFLGLAVRFVRGQIKDSTGSALEWNAWTKLLMLQPLQVKGAGYGDLLITNLGSPF